ncbi:Glutathione S-transferase 1 [Pseudolycoriella hygida]|uniref:glutathione transferase n=1 Tax=Pseudolycoriella hygida TaxID=35572 RepID=A0A9Q0MSW4_9DIPT|nr:Glutathione S-transferase 1 [Pseudolycoriella hygida]
MSSKPILYEMDITPGSRAVKMVARVIGLNLDIVAIDLFAGEHLTEAFIKMNPQHTVPTLNDNGNIIWESSVICTYLIDKYAKNDELYPKDLYERAKCNQRLHFSDGILYQRLRNCSMCIYAGGTEVPDKDIKNIQDAYELMETFLATDSYLVGDRLTVADLCAIGLIGSTHELYAPVTANKYPKLLNWFDRMKSLPFYDEMEAPFVIKYKNVVESIRAKNSNK